MRMTVEVKGSIPDPDFQKAITDSLKEIGRIAASQAKSRVPIRTGKLRSAIKPEIQENGTKVSIKPKSPYYHLVEFGARAHPITPKRKAVLRFNKGGALVYARAASSPGRKASPYLGPAIKNNKAKFQDMLAKDLEKACEISMKEV